MKECENDLRQEVIGKKKYEEPGKRCMGIVHGDMGKEK